MSTQALFILNRLSVKDQSLVFRISNPKGKYHYRKWGAHFSGRTASWYESPTDKAADDSFAQGFKFNQWCVVPYCMMLGSE